MYLCMTPCLWQCATPLTSWYMKLCRRQATCHEVLSHTFPCHDPLPSSMHWWQVLIRPQHRCLRMLQPWVHLCLTGCIGAFSAAYLYESGAQRVAWALSVPVHELLQVCAQVLKHLKYRTISLPPVNLHNRAQTSQKLRSHL